MAPGSKKPKASLVQLIPLVLIGVGLIIIGVVLPNFITNGITGTQEVSVVPSKVSFAAPNLSLNDLYGQDVILSDYRQQILLVNNWATWCPPCKLEMPILQKYFEDHAQQGFMLIGIEAGDTRQDVMDFVDENRLTFPIWLDPDEKALSAFRNDNLPSSYVIDHEGNVVLAWTGPISFAMLEKYVTPLLEK